jgi:hypothetical protein
MLCGAKSGEWMLNKNEIYSSPFMVAFERKDLALIGIFFHFGDTFKNLCGKNFNVEQIHDRLTVYSSTKISEYQLKCKNSVDSGFYNRFNYNPY